MKKILFLLATTILSSCQSKEEKVAEMIRHEMFRTLFDYESYEPIETSKIDSSFTTFYEEPAILHLAKKVQSLAKESRKYLDEFKDAKESYDIWSDSYSSYARTKSHEYFEKMGSSLKKGSDALDLAKKYQDSIKTEFDKFETKFQGFQVIHKFRCKNKGGQFDLGNYKYIFDIELKSILRTIDMDDEKDNDIKDIIIDAISEGNE